MNVWELSVPPCILCILLLFCLLYLSLLFSLFFFFFWNELSWKLIKNVYLNRGPNKLMLQCPSLLHQMYMLFINWMYFICDNKLCWTCCCCWTCKWKCLNFDYNFIEVCSQGSNWQYSSIGADNGLAPNRRQAITWTNDVLGCRSIYTPLGSNDLKSVLVCAILTPTVWLCSWSLPFLDLPYRCRQSCSNLHSHAFLLPFPVPPVSGKHIRNMITILSLLEAPHLIEVPQ